MRSRLLATPLWSLSTEQQSSIRRNAFGLLNLKNDSLRKRFDSIKYDVKRLEEGMSTEAANRGAQIYSADLVPITAQKVVYDLSLRGLLTPAQPDETAKQSSTATTRDGPAPAKRQRTGEEPPAAEA